MINKTHYIYGLFDPLTGEVRYIGRTVNLKKRLMEHMGKHTNDIKSAWINALKWQYWKLQRHWMMQSTLNTSGFAGVSMAAQT